MLDINGSFLNSHSKYSANVMYTKSYRPRQIQVKDSVFQTFP